MDQGNESYGYAKPEVHRCRAAELLFWRAATGFGQVEHGRHSRSQVRSSDVAIGSLAYPATQGAPGGVITWLAQLAPRRFAACGNAGNRSRRILECTANPAARCRSARSAVMMIRVYRCANCRFFDPPSTSPSGCYLAPSTGNTLIALKKWLASALQLRQQMTPAWPVVALAALD